ncbi:MAG: DUF6232 family protein [Christensenellaceae bacterium]|jgi:hypothetical protein|nr:DUF6232 family protein [Christensenellaceae bacterium]
MAINTADTGKVFKNETVSIEGNIIRCQQNFIQISSISQVWTGQLPKTPLPWLGISFLCVTGLLTCVIGRGVAYPTLGGLLLIGMGIGVFAWSYAKNKDLYGLHIEMSSGHTYTFIAEDAKFVVQAFEALAHIVRTKLTAENILLNFGSGKIVNQSTNVSA